MLEEKKIEFEELIDRDCSIPVDRIQKFMNMLKKELDLKKHKGE